MAIYLLKCKSYINDTYQLSSFIVIVKVIIIIKFTITITLNYKI